MKDAFYTTLESVVDQCPRRDTLPLTSAPLPGRVFSLHPRRASSSHEQSQRANHLHRGGRHCTCHLLIDSNACTGFWAISHGKRQRVLHTHRSCCRIPTDVIRIPAAPQVSPRPLLLQPRTRAVLRSCSHFHSCRADRAMKIYQLQIKWKSKSVQSCIRVIRRNPNKQK